MHLINVIPRARKEETSNRRMVEHEPLALCSGSDAHLLDMEEMFNRLFQFPAAVSHTATAFSPSLDVLEAEKEFQIDVEIPGMSASDVDLSVTKNTLTISGEKREEKKESSKGTYRLERRYGSFSRTVSLPENGIDIEKIEASFKDGVLTIKLPKATEYRENVKKIPVVTERTEKSESDSAPTESSK